MHAYTVRTIGISITLGVLLFTGVIRADAQTISGGPESAARVATDTIRVLPQKLFDIRLIIDRRELHSAQELVARTTFESFGRVPTSVALTFSIVDAAGKKMYSKTDSVVIETEGVLVTRFDGVALPIGSYVLRLHTQYSKDVTDNFEIPFTVVAEDTFPWQWVAFGAAVMTGIGIAAVVRYRRTHRRTVR